MRPVRCKCERSAINAYNRCDARQRSNAKTISSIVAPESANDRAYITIMPSPPATLCESYVTIRVCGNAVAAAAAALSVPERCDEIVMQRISSPACAAGANAFSNIAAVGCDVVGRTGCVCNMR
jgi:hypothetical protein